MINLSEYDVVSYPPKFEAQVKQIDFAMRFVLQTNTKYLITIYNNNLEVVLIGHN